jgi:hypothetical protein
MCFPHAFDRLATASTTVPARARTRPGGPLWPARIHRRVWTTEQAIGVAKPLEGITAQQAAIISVVAGSLSAVWCLLDADNVGAATVSGLVAAPVTFAGVVIIGADLKRSTVRRPFRLSVGLAAILLAQVLPPLFAGRRWPRRGGGDPFTEPATTQFVIAVVSLIALALVIRLIVAVAEARAKRRRSDE